MYVCMHVCICYGTDSCHSNQKNRRRVEITPNKCTTSLLLYEILKIHMRNQHIHQIYSKCNRLMMLEVLLVVCECFFCVFLLLFSFSRILPGNVFSLSRVNKQPTIRSYIESNTLLTVRVVMLTLFNSGLHVNVSFFENKFLFCSFGRHFKLFA